VSTREIIAGCIDAVAARARAGRPGHIPLIGLAGAQGCGKSFQARAYAAARGRVAHFSLDDVYLTRAERAALAARTHPLFATRGPPGTHDLALALETIASLRSGGDTLMPRFDKAQDDRAPRSAWSVFNDWPDLIVMEGWCLGALPLRDVGAPLNPVEAEDREGVWRSAVADTLAGDYARFFSGFDAFVYLRAPGFEIVRRWRAEQEAELRGRALTPSEDAALDRFVQHYERITRAMLEGRHSAAKIVHLDENRAAIGVEERC
jgi:D-glycerate 3-kinase